MDETISESELSCASLSDSDSCAEIVMERYKLLVGSQIASNMMQSQAQLKLFSDASVIFSKYKLVIKQANN